MTDTEDRELRALLHDAVADVEPTGTPDDLHARLDQQPRRAWLPLTLAAAVVTALVLVGVPLLLDRGPSTPPAAAPADTVDVVAYAAVETPSGPRLVADRREVASDDPLQAAVEETLNGEVSDPDFVRLWPGGTDVTVTRRADLVEVDFTEGLSGELPSESAVNWIAVQNVVWAVTEAIGDEDAEVRFLSEGDVMPVLLELDARSAFKRANDANVVAQVLVESVGEGQTFDGPFTVSGLASAFEGTVTWRLLDGDEVVREGFTTAAECCTPSPYSFEVDAPPGDYVLEVGETDPSDGEGFPPYVDTKRVSIR
jgi:hypothetical protein